jgi:hypothetical protein
MKHRTFTLSVCGAVFGVIVASSIVSYGSGLDLHATVLPQTKAASSVASVQSCAMAKSLGKTFSDAIGEALPASDSYDHPRQVLQASISDVLQKF